MSGFNQPPDDPGPEPEDDRSLAERLRPHTAPRRVVSEEQMSALSQAQLVEIGGEYDHVKVLSTEYPLASGSRAEKKAERQVAMSFTLAALLVVLFVVAYIAWPWDVNKYKPGTSTWASYYTPVLGITLGGALTMLGVGLVLWAKKLMPHEVSIQERHEGASPEIERRATAATLMSGLHDLGITRRTAIRRSALGAVSLLGLAVLVPVVGGLIKNPYKNNELYFTSWKKNLRLLRVNGTPIRPTDMEPGSLETVFPAVAGGDKQSNAATMLIRLHHDQVVEFKARQGQQKFRWNEYVAYSKICSHLGCPVSLYEQQTGLILCPCHQSQFDVTKDAAPVFGPATRSLPQLPITVDDEGYFVAQSDYIEAVGPAFWDRERRPNS